MAFNCCSSYVSYDIDGTTGLSISCFQTVTFLLLLRHDDKTIFTNVMLVSLPPLYWSLQYNL